MTEHETAPRAPGPRPPEPTPPAVLLDLTDRVATVTLNRPEAMNALDLTTKEVLLATLLRVAEDPAVRCVVLTGTGRAFCVGQDLREHVDLLANQNESLWSTVPKHYNPIVELLSTMEQARHRRDQRCRCRRRCVLRVRRRPAHHRRYGRL